MRSHSKKEDGGKFFGNQNHFSTKHAMQPVHTSSICKQLLLSKGSLY